ncbi:L-amino acid N-acyltransferase YncA [Brevibacterium siliguriense]|uniref:L-amino acid N-acyltransferase YncA n=1 Tax=Brevibacterium siliguriense TaxID=1136497 RepID=A0A1H1PI04_9MICO|nr:GNAT family N-acetyltransferase [Brevibacterium siliguriense]SDS10309.1 L-amino acid N-acyltransferase YncA [Brevibacterium siliguriense]
MAHTVRPPEPADAAAMARVHVDTWSETYRGIMPNELLDAPDLLDRRQRMWTQILAEAAPSKFTCVVAESDGRLVGIAMSGPPESGENPNDDNGLEHEPSRAACPEDRHLYVLYAYQSMHGTGVGQDLLDAVVDPTATTALWVADPNPRAQAFYSKNGFISDGTIKTDEYDGVREMRMVRQAED